MSNITALGNATLVANSTGGLGNQLTNGLYLVAGGVTVPYSYYPWQPMPAANIALAVVFAISFAGHAFQAVKNKAFYMGPLAVGVQMEMIGYGARFMNARQDPTEWSRMAYMAQLFSLVAAPIMYVMTLLALMKMCIGVAGGAHHVLGGPLIMTSVTIGACVLSFVLSNVGAVLLIIAKQPDNIGLASKALMGGTGMLLLAAQVIMVLGGLWVFKMAKNPSPQSAQLPPSIKWVLMAKVTCFCAMLVLIRCGFRVLFDMGIQLVAGKEMFWLAAEGGMMVQISLALNFFHPTRIMNLAALAGRGSGETEGQYDEIALSKGNSFEVSHNHEQGRI